MPLALMFDLDGTLVDTMFRFAALAAEIMTAQHGDDPKTACARYLETSGLPFIQQLEVMHPSHAGNRRASDEFEHRKRAITASTPIDERTKATLAALRAQGLRLVLSSNTGQGFVDEFIRQNAEDFELALGFDETAQLAKGEPHVAKTCDALGLSRDQLWFVGDSLKDGELAAQCGLAFVGRLGTFTRSQFETQFPGVRTVEHPEQLLEMLCKS